MTEVNGMTGEELGKKLEDAVTLSEMQAVVEDTPKRELTTEEKIVLSAKLCRSWQNPLNALVNAYLKEYPPLTTSKDVLRAVTVQVPLPAFMALITAMQTVLTSAPKEVE